MVKCFCKKGAFNGQQIVNPKVVEDIETGGDKDAFAHSPIANHSNVGYSYHNQWWMTHNEHRVYQGLGYGGQILYVDPVAELVIAKFSSYPTPAPAGEEYYSMMSAFPALGKYLM